MEKKTRVPVQKRSLEKYEKILTAAFHLFNERGYYNITTADISKEAGVATGSIYSYFVDKKEIYLEVIKRLTDKFFIPTHEFWAENGPIDLKDEESIKNLFRKFIKLMIDCHDFSKLFHDDMTALELLDEDIAFMRERNQEVRNQNTKDVFAILHIPFKNEEAEEIFLHYCNLLIDDVCHELLYNKNVINKEIYIVQAVDMLYRLLCNLTDL